MKKIRTFVKKHPDAGAIIILSLIFIFITAITMILRTEGFIWGSDTDWKSQHFAIPEYFRLRFYETHDLFPDFALQIGGGQNIYNFSYYGIANPLYLPAYALPFVKMSTYIQIVSLAIVIISSIEGYYFFKGHFRQKTALILAIMFLCSGGLLYHSHHHIMFMNYFPFLMGLLIGCRRNDTPQNTVFITVMSYCILCTSFYFSVGCFSAVIVYLIFIQLSDKGRFSLIQFIRTHLTKLIGIAAGCLCSAFMWMPTLMAILSGREKSSAVLDFADMLLLDVNLSTILYSGYSMGLTVFVLFSALYMLIKGKRNIKFLSFLLITFTLTPLINYIINAFMYLDGKAFLPFGPIMLLITGYFLSEEHLDFQCTIKSAVLLMLIGIMNILLDNFNVEFQKLTIPITAAIIFTAFFMIYICRCEREKLLPFYAAAGSVIICLINNCIDKFATSDNVKDFYNIEIEETILSTIENDPDMYRFANTVHNEVTVNRVFGMNYLSTSSYSSVNNPFLRDFRFNTSLSENRSRNNAIQNQPYNILFTTLMGCRYRMSSENMRMYDEEIVAELEDCTLYRNDYAFPLGYASSEVMNEDAFNELPPQFKAETLLNNIIIPEITESRTDYMAEQLFPDMTPLINDPHVTYENGIYTVNTQTEFTAEIMLEKFSENKILIVTTSANNTIGSPLMYSDVFLIVNGVKNKLTDPRWKYCNKNYDFTYVLSSYDIADRLTLTFSPGLYTISDIQVYALDASVLDTARKNKDEFIIDRNNSLKDSVIGRIDVRKDGWFNISLPYDKNFKVTVDGEPVEYFKTNTAFIGFPITAGHHDIEISFEAPLKKVGISTTVVSVILFGLYITVLVIRKRKI
ncbi:MAG: YfhO family protein [Ruminococcus sp.]|nr:YfhO family protein [Ruminococcus sp.]